MFTALLLIIKRFFSKRELPIIKNHTSNSALQTVMANWSGTPLDQNGLFINHEYPTVISYRAILKFMLQKNPQKQAKKQDSWRIDVLKNDDWLSDTADKIVWLGHASFFIQLSGTRILIDPIFGKLPIGRRYSDLPVEPHKLQNIDYILVSHAHYDHCDKNSLKLLSVSRLAPPHHPARRHRLHGVRCTHA